MEDAQAVSRGRLTLAVAERIRDMIVGGDLPSGERIGERALMERLGVTRTPLREAFKVLAAEGLVEIVPNRGALVTQLSLADVDAAIEVLVGLETIAAPLACERALEDEIAAIADLHRRMVEAHGTGDLMGYFHLNQAIHQGIVDAAHNAALSRVYRSESARIRRYRYTGNLDGVRWARALHEHAQILDAFQQRAGALLREILRAHHLAGWRVTRAMLADAAPHEGRRPAHRRSRTKENPAQGGAPSVPSNRQ
ncbi:GntR family transcriptional regulator [Chelatococcus daeguensis]|uniref:GntR family transcriptional regulator n=1 Tax=Chelatococcus daeguensis TaxID=444444 RepID=A0AAC9JQJ6_9HYPH|nr:GntR family transcriptional regulator [Chelatococcus daeguensis]APF36566.1 GntR family transcriptional regulator [Chelatococcus daeguensis]